MVRLELRVRLVLRDLLALLVLPGPQVRKEQLARRESQDQQARPESLVLQAPRVLMELRARLVQLVLKDLQVVWVQLALRARPGQSVQQV